MTQDDIWNHNLAYREAREVAQDVPPGVRHRRHNMSRYTLTWTRPR